MSDKEKLLGRVLSARQRVRDAAAAGAERAATVERAAEAARRDAAAALDGVLDGAEARLEGRGVEALHRLELERQSGRRAVEHAAAEELAAGAVSQVARAELAQRERAVRVSEKLLIEWRVDARRDEQRAEQRTVDDLGPPRHRVER